MAGLARLAVELGHRVTGADAAVYPPMSEQLAALGVEVHEGYDASALEPAPDVVVVGNALSRGNPSIEHVLSTGIPYTSGPAWLGEEVLRGRHVIAVAGTHGKTTVTSLVAWMLEHAGRQPGFLVGGVVENFQRSARLGDGEEFVVEADEYDTAFFDKRSKFIHYRPRTLVINNLEFDHADIFPDLAAIQRQFHHLIRTLPREAVIIRAEPDPGIDGVLDMGCWSRVQTFGSGAGADWRFAWERHVPAAFTVMPPSRSPVGAATPLMGEHNAWNTAAAVAAVADVGIDPARALAALASFRNVKRRLELRGERRGVRVFDDFAHHPTAIAATITALRNHGVAGRIIAVTELRSNTMRMGVHQATLAAALAGAECVLVLAAADLPWNVERALAPLPHHRVFTDSARLIDAIADEARGGDAVLIMSNGGFDNIHARLLEALEVDT